VARQDVGDILTTVTDVVGCLSFLGIATLLGASL
jgi:Mg/Co/Ni transporter MgtE